MGLQSHFLTQSLALSVPLLLTATLADNLVILSWVPLMAAWTLDMTFRACAEKNLKISSDELHCKA